MNYSFTFNSVDMNTYGLVVVASDIHGLERENESQLIQDLSWPFRPKSPPKMITLQVAVMATSRAVLKGYLDGIKGFIATDVPYNLVLDGLNDRYWLAKVNSFNGGYRGVSTWIGTIGFQADDPCAYDVSETDSPHLIDADHQTVIETPGGTAMISPVYTLTAGEELAAVTIKVQNINTDEELQWTGTLTIGQVLEINTDAWTIKKEGVADISTFTGQFPRLQPGANQIKVTAFSTTGTLDIKYRNRFL